MDDELKTENAVVLAQLAGNGDDLSRSRPVDFAAVFPDQFSAEAFAERAKSLGFNLEIEKLNVAEDRPWEVLAIRQWRPRLTP